jgi:dTMP kinase
MKPPFITFEGGEGAGKSTQIAHAQKFLQDRGMAVVRTREPGGSHLGDHVRAFLLTQQDEPLSAVTEYLLFSAVRRQHLEQVIWPSLKENQWVLCDRFYDSSWVYQGYVEGLDLAFMDQVYQKIAGDFAPDLTILLDIDPKTGLERTHGRDHAEDRFEKKGINFHEHVRQGFRLRASQDPLRFVILDGSMDEAQVASLVQTALERRFLS